jgi:hypothetical protein
VGSGRRHRCSHWLQNDPLSGQKGRGWRLASVIQVQENSCPHEQSDEEAGAHGCKGMEQVGAQMRESENPSSAAPSVSLSLVA